MWTGDVSDTGYGRFSGRVPFPGPPNWLAHRLVFAYVLGVPLPEHLHHECGNKLCVRPSHLLPTDLVEHQRIHHADSTHCKHGHRWTPENTYIRKDNGAKQCRACKAARQRGRRKVD